MKRAVIVAVGLGMAVSTALFVRRVSKPKVSEQDVVDYAVGEAIPALAHIGVRQCDASLAGLPVQGAATVETTADGIRVVSITLRADEETARVAYLPCLVKFLTGREHLRLPGTGPQGEFTSGQRFELEADWLLPDVTPSQMK